MHQLPLSLRRTFIFLSCKMSISITSSAIAAAWWFQLMRTLIIPNRAQQKYALHMQSYTPARLPRAVREVEAVSWSQDQRIAVTSSDTVSIFVSHNTQSNNLAQFFIS